MSRRSPGPKQLDFRAARRVGNQPFPVANHVGKRLSESGNGGGGDLYRPARRWLRGRRGGIGDGSHRLPLLASPRIGGCAGDFDRRGRFALGCDPLYGRRRRLHGLSSRHSTVFFDRTGVARPLIANSRGPFSSAAKGERLARADRDQRPRELRRWSMSGVFRFAHLLGEVILQAHAIDQAKLSFQPVDVLLGLGEDFFEELTGSAVLEFDA